MAALKTHGSASTGRRPRCRSHEGAVKTRLPGASAEEAGAARVIDVVRRRQRGSARARSENKRELRRQRARVIRQAQFTGQPIRMTCKSSTGAKTTTTRTGQGKGRCDTSACSSSCTRAQEPGQVPTPKSRQPMSWRTMPRRCSVGAPPCVEVGRRRGRQFHARAELQARAQVGVGNAQGARCAKRRHHASIRHPRKAVPKSSTKAGVSRKGRREGARSASSRVAAETPRAVLSQEGTRPRPEDGRGLAHLPRRCRPRPGPRAAARGVVAHLRGSADVRIENLNWPHRGVAPSMRMPATLRNRPVVAVQ